MPFIPTHFGLKLVQNAGVSRQFSVIKKLFKSAEELIYATDAGREGELIFRYILSLTGVSKKVIKRLWLSSLTHEAIEKAFQNLRSMHEYDNLYAAAKCRSESDWIVGLNGTRNLTVRYGMGGILWSIGRVQTPVLAMIVKRDNEIRHFIPEDFWELKTKYRQIIFKYVSGRFKRNSEAELIVNEIVNQPFQIINIESKDEKELPPLLFDLTELQKEMNRKYGFSAEKTLQIAQTLYERKYISYPRTDSRFLTEDIKGEIPGILTRLQGFFPKEIGGLSLLNLNFSRRIINDRKVGEHHAIIPTGKIPNNLDDSSQIVFKALLLRLVAVFYPSSIKKVTIVEGNAKGYVFQAKGVQVLELGWTSLYLCDRKEKSTDDHQLLPSFILGESGQHYPLIRQGTTEPPRQFNESTLLGAMETAGKLVQDENMKEALKQKGLGTPATRAAIIETLLKRKYIIREKKGIKATDLGRFLIALVQDSQMKSPELTGEWESKLMDIEKGVLNPTHFMEEITKYTHFLIENSDASKINPDIIGSCPLCKRPVIKGKKGFGCSGWKEGCKFTLWCEYKGISLNESHIQQLVQRKIVLTPMIQNGKKICLSLTENGILTDIPIPELTSFKKFAKSKNVRPFHRSKKGKCS